MSLERTIADQEARERAHEHLRRIRSEQMLRERLYLDNIEIYGITEDEEDGHAEIGID